MSVFALALTLATCTAACADVLTVTTTNLGGGMWKFDLTLTDPYPFPLSGLNILYANTLFGLDSNSVIAVPPGWDFFPPIPGVVDELTNFSLSSTSDAQPNIPLPDFSFDSATDPSTLKFPIPFDVVNGVTGTQVPEPELMPMVLICLSVATMLKQRLEDHTSRSPFSGAVACLTSLLSFSVTGDQAVQFYSSFISYES